jgi:beta-1,4-mannosyltransferase
VQLRVRRVDDGRHRIRTSVGRLTVAWIRRRSRERHSHERTVIVLLSVRLDVSEKSYMNHVADALDDPDIALRSFSYPAALLGRWDVLHVHWPETLARHHRPARRIAYLVGMLLLLVRISIGRKAVLRTVHNVAPHDRGSPIEAWLVGALDRRTTGSVLLNPYSKPVREGESHRSFLIPHGHYRNLVTETPYPVAGDDFHILYFGFIKPYKRIEDLLDAFAPLTSPRLRLRLIGRATPALAELAQQASTTDPRVSTHLDFMSDEQLSVELGRANLVVLPYRDPHNSGAALHALSANRPILACDNPVMRWIADEVGPQWVRSFEPPLDAIQLQAAITDVERGDYGHRVQFADRDWAQVAVRYAAAYRDVSSLPRSRRSGAADDGATTAATRVSKAR